MAETVPREIAHDPAQQEWRHAVRATERNSAACAGGIAQQEWPFRFRSGFSADICGSSIGSCSRPPDSCTSVTQSLGRQLTLYYGVQSRSRSVLKVHMLLPTSELHRRAYLSGERSWGGPSHIWHQDLFQKRPETLSCNRLIFSSGVERSARSRTTWFWNARDSASK